MNKTFKDPNTKYSDQGTPLAQASEALSAIGDVAETVDELTENVDELTETVDNLGDAVEEMSEKVELIPVPVVADEGKVLTATDDGAYELADVDALPAISAGDAGKVLMVNAGETGAEWSAPSGDDTIIYLDRIYVSSISPAVQANSDYSSTQTKTQVLSKQENAKNIDPNKYYVFSVVEKELLPYSSGGVPEIMLNIIGTQLSLNASTNKYSLTFQYTYTRTHLSDKTQAASAGGFYAYAFAVKR